MKKKFLFLIGSVLIFSACSKSEPMYTESNDQYANYDATYDDFIHSVSIKEKSSYSITYEYKDVRIDDIAVLAARYCNETYASSAHLQSIFLHRNNSKLATFHCYDLQ